MPDKIKLKSNQKSVFPIILIVVGLVESIIPLISIVFVVPKLIGLYRDAGVAFNSALTFTLLGLTIAIPTIQVIYGLVSINNQNRSGGLTTSQKNISIALITAGVISFVLMVPAMIFAIILPIYQLTNSVT